MLFAGLQLPFSELNMSVRGFEMVIFAGDFFFDMFARLGGIYPEYIQRSAPGQGVPCWLLGGTVDWATGSDLRPGNRDNKSC